MTALVVRKTGMRNVRFLNAPIARITGNSEFCHNEAVKLYGNTGLSNSYLWNITGPESYSDTLPNISFTPAQPGTYSANLTVTSPDGCSSTSPLLTISKGDVCDCDSGKDTE